MCDAVPLKKHSGQADGLAERDPQRAQIASPEHDETVKTSSRHKTVWTKRLSHYHECLRALPEERDLVVYDLRSRLRSGRYYVPSGSIAEVLLGRLADKSLH